MGQMSARSPDETRIQPKILDVYQKAYKSRNANL